MENFDVSLVIMGCESWQGNVNTKHQTFCFQSSFNPSFLEFCHTSAKLSLVGCLIILHGEKP